MKRLTAATALIALALAPAALAQTKPAQPTAASGDAAAEAKFKAADKNGSGVLEGAEADGYKTKMAQVDTNKDGKISHAEFLAGVKAGQIK